MKRPASKRVASHSAEKVGEASKQTPKGCGGKSARSPRSGLRSREGGKQSASHALSRSQNAESSAASLASAAGPSSVQRERGGEKRRFRGTHSRARASPCSSAETEALKPRGSSSDFHRKTSGREGERRAAAVGDNQRRQRGYGAPKTEEERVAERKRSVFVSNLPPDASREELDELFRSFGSLATIKLVGAASDGHSKEGKGITRAAFVIFKEEASAQQALAAYSAAPFQDSQSAGRSSEKGKGTRFPTSSALPPGMSVFAAEALGVSWQKANQEDRREVVAATARKEVLLRGQTLVVRPVISREEAGKLKGKSGWTRKEDSASRRHLNLAFEGMISPKSAAFEELPPAEQRRRLQAWQEKKEKMKNPNYFVNPTRLSVRNLPTSTSANDLRETMSHFLVKSPAFAQFESSRLAQREAEREARERREANTTGAEKSTQGEGQKPRVTDFSLLHPKQQRRLAEQAILKVRIIRDKERRRATSSQANGSTTKEKRSLGFAFVDCSHAEVAKLLLNFLGMCTSGDFLPENLAAQKQGAETEDETPRHGRTMWRRLMVEYAMEDARKVKLKEEKSQAYVQMLERQKKNQGGEEGDEQPRSGKASLPKKLKTYSRGKRQRERRRQARLAVAGVTDSQALLHGVGREKPTEKNKVSEQSSEGQKKLLKASVNESKRPKEAKKRKKSREDDEASSAEDEILVFDEEGETNESRIYPKRIKSHADSRRRRKLQRRSEQDNENLEDEYLKSRVQFLLSNQG
ncbi:UNVERIFIED_CONTAM: RNA recognition motif-containing protein [Hammondia hammondi]|eukprot:XP_008889353.1 RNA recognition motif-containing protein [Hammondia hammondi]